jgi:hypothetical protein
MLNKIFKKLVRIMKSFVFLDLGWDVHNFRDWCCHLYNSCSSVMQR